VLLRPNSGELVSVRIDVKFELFLNVFLVKKVHMAKRMVALIPKRLTLLSKVTQLLPMLYLNRVTGLLNQVTLLLNRVMLLLLLMPLLNRVTQLLPMLLLSRVMAFLNRFTLLLAAQPMQFLPLSRPMLLLSSRRMPQLLWPVTQLLLLSRPMLPLSSKRMPQLLLLNSLMLLLFSKRMPQLL
jgi:hypothetical protein